MANPLIETQFSFADPNASPLTINEFIALLNTLVASRITPENTYIPYVISADQPGVDDQDKAWIQIDTSGNPKALKLWTTTGWRRVYNGMMGEIRGFTGAPGYDVPPALFNEDGLGNVGLEYDGWQICNGKNGSPDLSDRFLIGAHMNKADGEPDYTEEDGWVTRVDGLANLSTGGVNEKLIEQKYLPALTNAMVDPVTLTQDPAGLYIYGREYKSDATHTDPLVLVDTHWAGGNPPGGPGQHSELLTKYGWINDSTATEQKKFPTVPPFYALAWIRFVGY